MTTEIIGGGITNVLSWMSSALTAMAGEPVLVAFFALSCIGAGVGAFRRLRRL